MSKKTHIEIDETDAPYKEGERPFPRTKDDDLLLLKIVEENKWELLPDSELAQLQKGYNLAKQAKRELRLNGKTTVICPKCGEFPVMKTTSGKERTTICCSCGYLYDCEINL